MSGRAANQHNNLLNPAMSRAMPTKLPAPLRDHVKGGGLHSWRGHQSAAITVDSGLYCQHWAATLVGTAISSTERWSRSPSPQLGVGQRLHLLNRVLDRSHAASDPAAKEDPDSTADPGLAESGVRLIGDVQEEMHDRDPMTCYSVSETCNGEE